MSKKTAVLIIIILLLALAATAAVWMSGDKESESVQRLFTASVLENKKTSILVQPLEGEDELNSSDKILVRVPKDSAVLEDLSEFAVGSKVKITYGGAIMESHPAQINADKVELAE